MKLCNSICACMCACVCACVWAYVKVFTNFKGFLNLPLVPFKLH